jgi:hypothetical protein
VDAARLWFKAKVGFDADQIPRESPSALTPFSSPTSSSSNDTLTDKRFAKNPLVVSEPAHQVLRGRAARHLRRARARHALRDRPRAAHVDVQQQEALRVLARRPSRNSNCAAMRTRMSELNRKTRLEIAERARAERERMELLAREQEVRAAAEANEQRYRFLAESIPATGLDGAAGRRA